MHATLYSGTVYIVICSYMWNKVFFKIASALFTNKVFFKIASALFTRDVTRTSEAIGDVQCLSPWPILKRSAWLRQVLEAHVQRSARGAVPRILQLD